MAVRPTLWIAFPPVSILNNLAVSFLLPDVDQCWAPETKDQRHEGIPKAMAVHLPPLSAESCDSQPHSDRGSVSSHATHAGTSNRTCAASNHVLQEPHQPCSHTSHDLQPHQPGSISQQCATSYGPPEQSRVVKYQMSVIYLIPLRCLSCIPQPCSHLSGEEGGSGVASTATDEWRHRDEPRTCWWVCSSLMYVTGNEVSQVSQSNFSVPCKLHV